MDNPEKLAKIGHSKRRKIKQKYNMCWTPLCATTKTTNNANIWRQRRSEHSFMRKS